MLAIFCCSEYLIRLVFRSLLLSKGRLLVVVHQLPIPKFKCRLGTKFEIVVSLKLDPTTRKIILKLVRFNTKLGVVSFDCNDVDSFQK